jgi:hypothetical protein
MMPDGIRFNSMAARMVVGALVLSTVLVSPAALAFPKPGTSGSCGPDITYRFTGGGWNPGEKAAIRDGLEDWEVVLDFDGGKVATVTMIPDFGQIAVRKVATPNGGGVGWSSCGQGLIQIQEDLAIASMESVARHEMGHILDLTHTGKDDSFGGPTPAMATCVGLQGKAMSQDDYGGLIHKQTSQQREAIHANASFEQGTSWWGISNIASFFTTTAHASDGTTSARIRPNSSTGYLFQTMNYAAAAGEPIDARINIRRLDSSHTGVMSFNILKRKVTYASPASCDYPTGKNQNVRSEGSWVVVRVETCTPSNSWATCTEGTLYTVPSGDAHDLRITVYSNVKTSSGTYATVAVDFARIRDRS